MSAEILYEGDVSRIVIALVDRATRAAIPMPNTTQPMTIIRPDKTRTTWTFSPATAPWGAGDGSDGIFMFVTTGGGTPDLNQPGTWRVVPVPTDGVGAFTADPDTFEVRPNP